MRSSSTPSPTTGAGSRRGSARPCASRAGSARSPRSAGSLPVGSRSLSASVSRPSMRRSCRELEASSSSRTGRSDAGIAPVRHRDLQQRAVDGQRGAQLVGGVGDEPALAVEGVVEAFQHRVERVGQVLDLVVRPGHRDAPVQRVGGQAAGGLGDALQQVEGAPGHVPPDRQRDEADEHGGQQRPLDQGTQHRRVVVVDLLVEDAEEQLPLLAGGRGQLGRSRISTRSLSRLLTTK